MCLKDMTSAVGTDAVLRLPFPRPRPICCGINSIWETQVGFDEARRRRKPPSLWLGKLQSFALGYKTAATLCLRLQPPYAT